MKLFRIQRVFVGMLILNTVLFLLSPHFRSKFFRPSDDENYLPDSDLSSSNHFLDVPILDSESTAVKRTIANVKSHRAVDMRTLVRPGTQLLFAAVYLEGGISFEMLGDVGFPKYIPQDLQNALNSSMFPATHLHVRLGCSPIDAVANSAWPAGTWMLEDRVDDGLIGHTYAPLIFQVHFADNHFDVSLNMKPLVRYRYRFDPSYVFGFRYFCSSQAPCVMNPRLEIRSGQSSSDCFGDFCRPSPPPRGSHDHDAHPTAGIRHSFYINLSHRTDRRRAIERLLTRARIPFERVEAVDPRAGPDAAALLAGCFDTKVCPGQVGCQLSHLRALSRAMDRGLEHVAIFEDDFVFQPFVNLSRVQRAVAAAMRRVPDWDVIALSLNILSETNLTVAAGAAAAAQQRGPPPTARFARGRRGLARLTWVHAAHTTGGYVVRRRMMPQIYDAFLPGNCPVRRDYYTAIDTCWRPLQARTLWVGFDPQPGSQGGSYSDIEGRHVDYRDLFRDSMQ